MSYSQIDRVLEGEVLPAAIPQSNGLMYRPDRQTRALMREDAGRALRAYGRVKYEEEIEREQANGRRRLTADAMNNTRAIDDALIVNCLGRPGLQDVLRELQAAYQLGEVNRVYRRATDY
jgi:hypothetical protein